MEEKVTVETLTDQWLIDKGYFRHTDSVEREGYEILTVSEDWRRVFADCMYKCRKKIEINGKPYLTFSIITPEILCETLNAGKHMKRIQMRNIRDINFPTRKAIGRPKGIPSHMKGKHLEKKK